MSQAPSRWTAFTRGLHCRCPACGEGRLRLVRTAKEPFWGCDRYKAGCKASYRDKGGKPELAAQGKVK